MLNTITGMTLALPRLIKRSIVLCVDVSLCVITVWLAFYLRLGEWVGLSQGQRVAVIVSVAIGLPIFVSFGLYRTIFRHAGWSALVTATQACLCYGIFYSALFTAWSVPGVPRTVGLIQPGLLLIFLTASRGFARYWLGGMYQSGMRHHRRSNVIIYGAGSAGRQLATALESSLDFRLVGFIDDKKDLHGSVLNGLRIWKRDDLAGLIERNNVSDLFLAIPSASRKRRNEILHTLRHLSVSVRTLPSLMDLAHGRVTINDLRSLEIEDLLGRPAVVPNSILLGKNVCGKTVLVTGAGGSIGSELCRQIVALGPHRLLLVDISEFALYSIHQELCRHSSGTEIVPLLGSVRSGQRMREIIACWRPDTIYHAAAYKHVPLVEHNVVEGVHNNVWGTYVTACVAQDYDVSDFVLISTDKAVRPTNVMGASKRLAEMTLQALADGGSSTRFSMVRFGNVLGSSGSVVPLFRQQIAQGGPVTITHADITRYFMTIPEAAQLVIQAGAMATGGEVFVLDMGEPVRIMDLAREMIQLSGLSIRDENNPDGDIEIKIVGLRPGEKLYEELLIGGSPSVTIHPRIMKATEHYLSLSALRPELKRLEHAIEEGDVSTLRERLIALVGEYRPESEVVDWVHQQQTVS